MLMIKPKYKKKIPRSKIQTVDITKRYRADEQELEAVASKRQRIDKLINGKGIIYE